MINLTKFPATLDRWQGSVYELVLNPFILHLTLNLKALLIVSFKNLAIKKVHLKLQCLLST
jgi:hypothetical protein